MPRLDENDISRRLAELGQWTRDGDEITRTLSFPSFADAIAFVNRVATLADAADHHPDIDIRYDKVRLALSTHSAGGLTRKDFDLAGRINATTDAAT